MDRDTLNMALKKPYYDQILKGVKTTEYRDMKDYWIDKLVDKAFYKNKSNSEIRDLLVSGKAPLKWNKWKRIRFWHEGRNMLVEVKGMEVYDHHPMFAIKLGKILESNNDKKEE